MKEGGSPTGIFDLKSPQIRWVSGNLMNCAAVVDYISFSIDQRLPSPLRCFRTTPYSDIHPWIYYENYRH